MKHIIFSLVFQVIYGIITKNNNNEQELACHARIRWIFLAVETDHIPTICLSQLSKSIGNYGRVFLLLQVT